jgi:hypothetical protein
VANAIRLTPEQRQVKIRATSVDVTAEGALKGAHLTVRPLSGTERQEYADYMRRGEYAQGWLWAMTSTILDWNLVADESGTKLDIPETLSTLPEDLFDVLFELVYPVFSPPREDELPLSNAPSTGSAGDN